MKGTNSCGTRDTKTKSAQPSIATIHSIVCNSFVSLISVQSQSEEPAILLQLNLSNYPCAIEKLNSTFSE